MTATHYIVFKQISAHLPHEANVEQYFSRAVSHSTDPSPLFALCSSHTPLFGTGSAVDPNIDPEFLGMLVMVGINRKKFKPLLKAIKELYFKKFRGQGGEDY